MNDYDLVTLKDGARAHFYYYVLNHRTVYLQKQ